jgi:hypothetical protein
MTKYIVVKCRGTFHKIYEDMFNVALAKAKKKVPNIPTYHSTHNI